MYSVPYRVLVERYTVRRTPTPDPRPWPSSPIPGPAPPSWRSTVPSSSPRHRTYQTAQGGPWAILWPTPPAPWSDRGAELSWASWVAWDPSESPAVGITPPGQYTETCGGGVAFRVGGALAFVLSRPTGPLWPFLIMEPLGMISSSRTAVVLRIAANAGAIYTITLHRTGAYWISPIRIGYYWFVLIPTNSHRVSIDSPSPPYWSVLHLIVIALLRIASYCHRIAAHCILLSSHCCALHPIVIALLRIASYCHRIAAHCILLSSHCCALHLIVIALLRIASYCHRIAAHCILLSSHCCALHSIVIALLRIASYCHRIAAHCILSVRVQFLLIRTYHRTASFIDLKKTLNIATIRRRIHFSLFVLIPQTIRHSWTRT